MPSLAELTKVVAPPAAAETNAAPQLSPNARSVAIREVLGFQHSWVAELPVATTLLISTREGGRLLLTTSRTAYCAALEAQVPAFVGSEISAMALAAEHDRASPAALAAWCAEKLREPGFRVTERNALDIAEPRRPEQGWSVAQVLRAYGAELREVCMGNEVPL